MTVLVTGGCGFIGSNLVRALCQRDISVVNLDKLTYAGNLESLADLEGNPRHTFVHGDICDRELVQGLLSRHKVDTVYHLAAESHVDRSILGPEVFAQTNVMGTSAMLEASRRAGVRRFLHVSTDEVYGSLGPEGAFTETTPLAPSSPYSASKAGSDLLALAYHHTFGLDVIVSRCSNNYGAYQFPEKLIPLMIQNALADKPLPVYGDGQNVREWIQVEDHNEALIAIAERGRPGEVYNIGSGEEQPNLAIVRRILSLLGKPESLIQFVKDRPGHDRRYAIDSSKLRTELGWRPRHGLGDGLGATVAWYRAHQDWCGRVTSGEYRHYYETQYRHRMETKQA